MRVFSAKKGHVWVQNIWQQLSMTPWVAGEQRVNDSQFGNGRKKEKLSRSFPDSENLFAAANEVVLLAEVLLTLGYPLLQVSWDAGSLQSESIVFLRTKLSASGMWSAVAESHQIAVVTKPPMASVMDCIKEDQSIQPRHKYTYVWKSSTSAIHRTTSGHLQTYPFSSLHNVCVVIHLWRHSLWTLKLACQIPLGTKSTISFHKMRTFERSAPRASVLLLPFYMHSKLPCFKTTSGLCSLTPRLSALVALLQIVKQMKRATNPGRKITTVCVLTILVQ